MANDGNNGEGDHVVADDGDGGGDVDDFINIIYLWTEIMVGRDVPPPSSQTLSILSVSGWVSGLRTQVFTECTEFPIPSCREVVRIMFREFPCPAWAVVSCSSGPTSRGNSLKIIRKTSLHDGMGSSVERGMEELKNSIVWMLLVFARWCLHMSN